MKRKEGNGSGRSIQWLRLRSSKSSCYISHFYNLLTHDIATELEHRHSVWNSYCISVGVNLHLFTLGLAGTGKDMTNCTDIRRIGIGDAVKRSFRRRH